MDHAILAMELCFPMIPGDALQGQLGVFERYLR